jgi:hypothetical protein
MMNNVFDCRLCQKFLFSFITLCEQLMNILYPYAASYHQSFQINFVTEAASCILSLNLFFIFICIFIFIFIFIYKEFAVKISYQAKALKYFRNLPLVEIMENYVFCHHLFTSCDDKKQLEIEGKTCSWLQKRNVCEH